MALVRDSHKAIIQKSAKTATEALAEAVKVQVFRQIVWSESEPGHSWPDAVVSLIRGLQGATL
jgi:hypothetical protein